MTPLAWGWSRLTAAVVSAGAWCAARERGSRRRGRGWLGVVVVGSTVLVGCEASAVTPPPRYLFPPVDDAAGEPVLYATRTALLQGLRAGDPETLRMNAGVRPDAWRTVPHWLEADGPLSAPFVEREMARLEQDPARVRQLSEMLRYGGVFTSTDRLEFCAPYWWGVRATLTDLPAHLQGEQPPWAVIVPETVVRTRPALDAPVLHTLGLELIRVHEGEPADTARKFVAVQLGALRGFVERAAVRNLADEQHACFRLKSNLVLNEGIRWRLVTIVY